MGPGLRRDDTECVAATWLSIADKPSRSRGVIARGLRRPSPQRRGSRECRVRAAPAVSCAGCAKKEMHTSIQVQRETLRHSLRNGLTAYAALSPATSSSCHRRPRIDGERPARSGGFAFANLTPATGARTTRFCRTQQHRSSACRTSLTGNPPCDSVSRQRCRVHRIPSRVRDDSRSAPLVGKGRGELVELICPTAKAKYFL